MFFFTFIRMKMTNIILLLILSRSVIIHCTWTLLWNDEFDQVKLNFDNRMWDIEDTGNRCNEPFDSQLNCMTSRDENVRTIEGALAITANHLDKPTQAYKKPFTSAYIYSAEYFTQGKFEVRAAMPKGKSLRAQINLYEPQEHDNTWVGIALADFKQTNTFEVGVWEMGGNFSRYFSYEHGSNLSDYHVYSLEREKGFLRWYFDGHNYFNYSFNEMDNRLKNRLNAEMEIDINLVVGGPKMSNHLSRDDAENWTCSSLIVDYVRVYQLSEEPSNESKQLKNTEKLPNSICELVRELRFLNSTESASESNPSLNFIYLVIPIIMILVAIIVILIWKLKHHKTQIARIDEQGKEELKAKSDENFYSTVGDYDNFTQENLYEHVGVSNYDEMYLEVYNDVMQNNSPTTEEPRYEKMTKEQGHNFDELHETSVYV